MPGWTRHAGVRGRRAGRADPSPALRPRRPAGRAGEPGRGGRGDRRPAGDRRRSTSTSWSTRGCSTSSSSAAPAAAGRAPAARRSCTGGPSATSRCRCPSGATTSPATCSPPRWTRRRPSGEAPAEVLDRLRARPRRASSAGRRAVDAGSAGPDAVLAGARGAGLRAPCRRRRHHAGQLPVPRPGPAGTPSWSAA